MSPKPLENTFADWNDIQLTYSIGLVHGLHGQPTRSRDAIAALEARLPPHVPDSIAQRWLLWKADILMIAGLPNEALEAADRAVRGYDLKLGSYGFAGAFARWTAITCLGNELEASAREVLAQMEQRLDDFDAIDQLEILCANAYVGGGQIRYFERIANKAGKLPPPAIKLIRALGMSSYV